MPFEFGHPWFLLLLGVTPLVWLALRYSLRDFEPRQQLLMATTRTLVIVLLILALSQVRWQYSSDRIAHVFVVDTSGSVAPEALAQAHEFVNRAWRQRNHDEVRVITFAARARVLDFSPTARAVPEFTRDAPELAQATDLAGALRLALSLMPADSAKRITVLSDGNETRHEAAAEIARARALGVKVFAIPLGRRLEGETAIASITPPGRVNLNDSFNAPTTISATRPTTAELALWRDGELVSTETHKLQAGDNQINLRLQADKPGLNTFEIRLRTPDDAVAENNTVRLATIAEGKPRVLYVEGQGQAAQFLAGALRREQIEVEQRGGLPGDLAQFGQYDLIIVSDTKAAALGTQQMALLESYVNDLGGGVVLAGGDGSFGIGGFNDTPVERISPVSFRPERKQMPSLALILVMDKSGSMAGRKIELAKDAAVAAVNALDDQEVVGVLEFDHTWEWLAQPRPASERGQLREQISGMQASGGTNIYSALEESFNMLKKTQARTKHVILMTDGRSQAGDYQRLVETMANEKITVTAVAIGSGSDRELIDNIARWGNGRSYFTESGEDLPQIFVRETKHRQEPQTLIEQSFRPVVQKQAEIISGIDFLSAPALLGYNETEPKPTSETLLTSPKGHPILSRWRYGLGKVAAFTSDVKNRWAVNWLNWSGYSKFWTQLVRDTMRRRQADGLNLKLAEHNQQALVTVETEGEEGGGQVAAVVVAPDSTRYNLPLRQTELGVYRGQFPLEQPGEYLITTTRAHRTGLTATASAALSLSPAAEYARLTTNEALLERLTRETGGKLSPTVEELFQRGGERIYALRDIWQALLWAALPLFLADIFLRRVRLFEPK